jgi:spermidine/putrescine transport system substrate-binding protein
MKKWWACLLIAITAISWAKNNVVNVFAWSDYIPHEVVSAFEKDTGITVNLAEYDSNEDLYAKLKSAPHSGYDVIIPSSYYVSRMRRENMLRPLDYAKLNNAHYLDPILLNKKFDPGNQYTLPYVWGTTGIVVDKRFWDPKTVQHWSALWAPRFRNQLLLYDDFREVFAMGLITLGFSINTQNPQEIKQAYVQLRKLTPNVRIYSGDVVISAFADNDITAGMMESEDYILAKTANPNLVYIFPKEGFAMWQDCFAIPKYAPHYSNAMRFIDYILRPEVGKQIAMSRGGSSPNLKTRELLPPAYRNNPVRYPSAQVLKRAQMENDIGDARKKYIHFWQLLKLSS